MRFFKFYVILVLVVGLFFPIRADAARDLTKAIVVFTFDDGTSDLYDVIYKKIFKPRNLSFSGAIIPAYIGDSYYVSANQLKEMNSQYSGRFEVMYHGYDHTSFLLLSMVQIQDQLRQAKNYFNSLGIYPPGALAYPKGDFSQEVIDDALIPLGFIKSGRQAWKEDSNFNWPENFDPWRVNVISLRTDVTTVEQFKGAVDNAVAMKACLVAVGHVVVDNPDPANLYQRSTADMTAMADYVKNLQDQENLKVMTISGAVSDLMIAKKPPNITPIINLLLLN